VYFSRLIEFFGILSQSRKKNLVAINASFFAFEKILFFQKKTLLTTNVFFSAMLAKGSAPKINKMQNCLADLAFI
jgi:hypothetical protein